MAGNKEACRFTVSGRVQGVGYRDFAQRVAQELQVTGHAKNLADQTVEVYAIGTKAQLEQFAARLAQGPRAADVRNVERREAEMLHYESFSVKY